MSEGSEGEDDGRLGPTRSASSSDLLASLPLSEEATTREARHTKEESRRTRSKSISHMQKVNRKSKRDSHSKRSDGVKKPKEKLERAGAEEACGTACASGPQETEVSEKAGEEEPEVAEEGCVEGGSEEAVREPFSFAELARSPLDHVEMLLALADDAGVIKVHHVKEVEYSQTIQGSEFVEWLIQPPLNISSRREGVQIGNKMVQDGLIISINPKKYMNFVGDEAHYYRVTQILSNRDYNTPPRGQRSRAMSVDTGSVLYKRSGVSPRKSLVSSEGLVAKKKKSRISLMVKKRFRGKSKDGDEGKKKKKESKDGKDSRDGRDGKDKRVAAARSTPIVMVDDDDDDGEGLPDVSASSEGVSRGVTFQSRGLRSSRVDTDGMPQKTAGRTRSLEFLKSMLRPADMTSLKTVVLENSSVAKAILVASADKFIEQIPCAMSSLFLRNDNPFLISVAVASEVTDTAEISLLFRTDTVYVRVISKYTQTLGQPFLMSTVAHIVKLVIECGDVEIDPMKMAAIEQLHSNRMRLLSLCTRILQTLDDTATSLPFKFRELLLLVYATVERKFEGLGCIAVGSCFLLRFVLPALVTPEKYGIVKKTLSTQERRKLILVSKVLQSISNETDFSEEKDPIMKVVQRYVVDTVPQMRHLCDKMVSLDLAEGGSEEVDVSAQDEENALTDLYYFVLLHKQRVVEELSIMMEKPADAERHKVALEKAMDSVS